MFERFTDQARRVVVLAQEEARQLGHNYIGTEHLLLALMHQPGSVAGQALAAAGATHVAGQAAVLDIVGRGTDTPSGHVPFTPRSKRVLEKALRHALQYGHNYIGTEHILLGLLDLPEGVGCRALETMGIRPQDVQGQVVALLGGGAGGRAPGAGLPRGVRVEAVSTSEPVRLPDMEDVPVLRRFRPDARRVLLLAESEALRLGRSGVGEEHVLLGLLAEGEGRGARGLAAVGVTLEDAREKAERSLGRGEGSVGRTAVLLASAVEVIELALVEAVVAGRHDIDTEDLLLGFVRRAEAGDGVARTALSVLGTTPDAVREALGGLDAA
jgi:ATP-dependent Clp protease ATP-binding subunit ClpA